MTKEGKKNYKIEQTCGRLSLQSKAKIVWLIFCLKVRVVATRVYKDLLTGWRLDKENEYNLCTLCKFYSLYLIVFG